MRNIIIYIFALLTTVATSLGLSSCSTHGSNNGDLDGFWYLRQIDTLSTGSQTDVHEQRIFWSYIGTLMQTEGGGSPQIIYRFDHNNTQLRVYDPYENIQGDDRKVTEDNMELLRPVGINALDETFAVEKLTSDEMILRSNTLRLHFIKY